MVQLRPTPLLPVAHTLRQVPSTLLLSPLTCAQASCLPIASPPADLVEAVVPTLAPYLSPLNLWLLCQDPTATTPSLPPSLVPPRDSRRSAPRRLKPMVPTAPRRKPCGSSSEYSACAHLTLFFCSVNEALMLGTAEQRHAAAASAVAAAQPQGPTSGF